MDPLTSSERPLRIAHVISCRGLGGAEEVVASLVEEGRVRGCTQLLLVPFANEASSALAELCPTASYEAMACNRPWRLPAARRWARRRLAAFGPDIVHIHLFHASILMASIRRARAPRLVTHHYGEGIDGLSHPRARMALDRWAMRQVDHVSATSDSVHAFLRNRHGLPPSSLGQIRLGWRGTPLPRVARNVGEAPSIVCVAMMRPEKGHDVLLTAFASVCRALPGTRLVLVGDGPHLPAVQRAATAAGLADGVRFVGRVEDIWPHLRDADVFAIASRNEALGLAIMEAMAAGLPVVAPAVGGIPELVDPGTTGYIFAPGDHDAMARHLIELLSSGERRQQMSAAAQVAAETMHMSESMRRYFELYAELIQRQAGAERGSSRRA